ncbi:MAG TPA: DUF2227 family putative metal-binding protein [Anaerolineales bacterium]|nr:DUF2227 family putative metal-binding protein [Anaerolineales bacterium]
MADGKTHALGTQVLAVLLFAAEATNGRLNGYSLQPTFLYSAALAGGAMLGLILTPDLDVNAGSFSDDEVREISPLGENLWWVYWFPYRVILPHRSPFSHWPILGTVGRLLYISIPYWMALAATYFLYPSWFDGLAAGGLWVITLPYFRAAALGLAGADLLHFFMDRRLFHKIFKQSRAMMQRHKELSYIRYD